MQFAEGRAALTSRARCRVKKRVGEESAPPLLGTPEGGIEHLPSGNTLREPS